MNQTTSCSLTWIRLGVAAGIASCPAYPALAFLHLPRPALVFVAAALGPLLGVATLGLGRLLQVTRESVPAQLAVSFNFAGGALVTAMLLVQLAARIREIQSRRPVQSTGLRFPAQERRLAASIC